MSVHGDPRGVDPRGLIGAWSFVRTIHDRATGVRYEADGDAELLPSPDGRIRWAEAGELRWSDRITPVRRTLYLVRAVPGGSASAHERPAWDVTFDDGRLFHPWTIGAVSHVCGADRYRGAIVLPDDGAAPAAWRVTWHVAGPHKSYTSTTRYEPRSGRDRDRDEQAATDALR